ncbi:hypothetical protein GGR56DRAFT_521568 [Xylariaceae sp. FL0804]|nr:hypothetical protein GGR56DRAFT_521568 [Xylariaceae sp. FL0804]
MWAGLRCLLAVPRTGAACQASPSQGVHDVSSQSKGRGSCASRGPPGPGEGAAGRQRAEDLSGGARKQQRCQRREMTMDVAVIRRPRPARTWGLRWRQSPLGLRVAGPVPVGFVGPEWIPRRQMDMLQTGPPFLISSSRARSLDRLPLPELAQATNGSSSSVRRPTGSHRLAGRGRGRGTPCACSRPPCGKGRDRAVRPMSPGSTFAPIACELRAECTLALARSRQECDAAR